MKIIDSIKKVFNSQEEEKLKKELNPIETDNWLNVYFDITYTPQKKNETEKESGIAIDYLYSEILNIILNTAKVVNLKGEIVDYLTPSQRMMVGGVPEGLLRNFSFKTNKIKKNIVF